MKKTTNFKDYFCGNKISEYRLANGYVDYRTLTKSFDAVMNNDIISKTANIGYWEIVNGDYEYYEDENGNIISVSDYEDLTEEEQEKCEYYNNDIYQYFIIDDNGYNILSDYTEEIIFYNEELDMYIWGITHCGTSWDYVLTNIPCNRKED